MRDVVNWFEIPVTDIERAASFYGAIFGRSLEIAHGLDFASALFPHDEGIGGGLVAGDGYTPNSQGSLIYLNANPDLNIVLGRVRQAGGEVLKAKTDIGENGFFALILDTEGNRVALHSIN